MTGAALSDWLSVIRGQAPLVVSLPHTGTAIPAPYANALVSPWLARKDTDWWLERLYDFAPGCGATVIRTAVSRTVVDVNRDPSGASLYPGQATTELCPTTTFDGDRLYRLGMEPDAASIDERRSRFFDPYHAALQAEIARLRSIHGCVVVYDCHSIRSAIPRLFDGSLPHFNIGTNGGASCNSALTGAVEKACGDSFSQVTNGRFKGGWITRRYGRPQDGIHALQMELACRSYMREPLGAFGEEAWPSAYDPDYAAPMTTALARVLHACLRFATSSRPGNRS